MALEGYLERVYKNQTLHQFIFLLLSLKQKAAASERRRASVTTETTTLNRCHRGTAATTGTAERPASDGTPVNEDGKPPETAATAGM